MGMGKFILYFIVGLLGTIFLLDNSPNTFISAFIIALVIGMIGGSND